VDTHSSRNIRRQIMNRRSVFTFGAIAAVSLAAATIPAVVTPAAAQMVYVGDGWDRDRDGRRDNRYRWRSGWGDRDRDGIPNRFDRYDNRHRYVYGYRHGYGWRDSDRDGVPNRWDRFDYNPYRR